MTRLSMTEACQSICSDPGVPIARSAGSCLAARLTISCEPRLCRVSPESMMVGSVSV